MPRGCVARGVIVRRWGREAVERVKGGGRQATAGERASPARRAAGSLLLPGLDGVAVLTCDNLDLRRLNHFVGFHFEGGILDDERPDVVAQTVCV